MVKKRRLRENKTMGFRSLVSGAFIFCLLFFVILMLFTAVFSLITLKFEDPIQYVSISAYASVLISAFVCAFLFSKRNCQMYFLGGLTLGTFILIIMTLVTLAFGDKLSSTDIIVRALIPLVSVLGALFGVKREGKRKRKNKNLRK